jgi:hypothetical protein
MSDSDSASDEAQPTDAIETQVLDEGGADTDADVEPVPADLAAPPSNPK